MISCAILVDQIRICCVIQLLRVQFASRFTRVCISCNVVACLTPKEGMCLDIQEVNMGHLHPKSAPKTVFHRAYKNHETKVLGCSQLSLMTSEESEKLRVPDGPTLGRLRFILLRIFCRMVL